MLTFVDEVEVPPELPIKWMEEMGKLYLIQSVALDSFRYALVRDYLKEIGFYPEKKNVKLVRPSDIMKVAVVIGHIFTRQLITWGTSKIMRWYAWNTKAVTDSKGNVTYEKIEERSRKTDGFMAYVAAETEEDKIKQRVRVNRRLSTIC
mgnify:FL=1